MLALTFTLAEWLALITMLDTPGGDTAKTTQASAGGDLPCK